jgi:hypothetical protein
MVSEVVLMINFKSTQSLNVLIEVGCAFMCSHDDCSYVYNYLRLYVFLKKEIISSAYIQIRTIVGGPAFMLNWSGFSLHARLQQQQDQVDR